MPAHGQDQDQVLVEEWDGEVAPDGGVEDCDGADGTEDGLESTVPPASARGWGAGWPRCQTARLATVVVPGGVRLAVRREIAPLVARLCAETVRRGYALHRGQCWGFACRSIRGRTSPSNHSWGLAVDLNSLTNPMGPRLVTDMPPWLPALWRDHGFRWGGAYSGRKDAMHFEYIRTRTAAAKAVTQLGPGTRTAAPPVAARRAARRAAPPFPLPRGHYFGVDRTSACHSGQDAADRQGVRTVQARLVERGWSLGPHGVDGRFGDATRGVVQDFQREKGLHVDGRVGPHTWAALWQTPITR